ncbi:MAG: pyruvate formate lyase family protein [Anaerolineales bacterium]
MNERLSSMKERVRDGTHRTLRQFASIEILNECEARQLSWPKRMALLVRRQCEAEQVIIKPDERIVFTRTLPGVPQVYSYEEWAQLTAGRTLHEFGPISNICADWNLLLTQGLLGRIQVALETRERLAGETQSIEFLDCAIETIEAVLELAAQYAAKAREMGRQEIADTFQQVLAYPARTFHEALQSLRLCQAVVWLSGHYHVGLGRFDQYMWPFLVADLKAGRLKVETAEELLAEFFISLNKDSDLYPGVQQGDNGQSLTLGGITPDGDSAVNELTRMVLRVSRDLGMIDPKINLRISAQTNLDLLVLATELTRIGLGFPQYSNDDVVIPALVSHGYDLEDARDYVVAACWEFIIPGRGMEVVNIGAVSFPAAADVAIREGLKACDDFEGILDRVTENINQQVHQLGENYSRLLLPPSPYYSVFMDGCLEQGKDLSEGLKYNNFGIHGACAANAADALAAVKQFVIEEGSIPADDLLSALEGNFAGYETLRCKLFDEGSKVGNNEALADTLLVRLFDDFATACDRYGQTARGGLLRPGTGSAMYYIWLASGHEGMREPVVGATADGRFAGDPFGANLSPSLGVRLRGPISMLQSFAKIDYQRIYNGGPITMELSDTVFRNAESIRKTAMLVRTFVQLGCQQLQLNSLNLETLLEAQKHPENYKNLIVRVWGWSGYFCELAPEYQEQIIARHYYE